MLLSWVPTQGLQGGNQHVGWAVPSSQAQGEKDLLPISLKFHLTSSSPSYESWHLASPKPVEESLWSKRAFCEGVHLIRLVSPRRIRSHLINPEPVDLDLNYICKTPSLFAIFYWLRSKSDSVHPRELDYKRI